VNLVDYLRDYAWQDLRLIGCILAEEQAGKAPETESGQSTVRFASPPAPDARQPPTPVVMPPAATPDPAGKIDLETQALAMLFKHPDWSLPQIAEHLRVDRRTLYKWKKFRQAATAAGKLKPRGAKEKDRHPRRGHKTPDGRVEAPADEGENE
jgi:hypothetical protein